MRAVNGIKYDADEKLWRYCTTERFAWILKSSRMYFASANEFDDPFEGAVAVQTTQEPVDPRYAEMEQTERAFFELKRLTKLNCWHRADYESDAMWRLYADQSKGIAICSTAARMDKAFVPYRLKPEYGEEELWGSPVQYVDLTQIRMRGVGMMDRFFFKHRAFESEREFRLAISVRMAEEFSVTVPEKGIEVSVDLNVLIDHIVIGPKISAREQEQVVTLATEAGLGKRLRFSSLLGKPRYI
jgi:hypothetical protein